MLIWQGRLEEAEPWVQRAEGTLSTESQPAARLVIRGVLEPEPGGDAEARGEGALGHPARRGQPQCPPYAEQRDMPASRPDRASAQDRAGWVMWACAAVSVTVAPSATA